MNLHPSNVLRFCPFCGAKGFAWDGVKSHTCPICKHKMYTNQASATVAIITNPKGELLFVKRKFEPAKGTLDLPGGFVDLGETAQDAIIREVKEEVNLEVNNLQFFGSFPNQYPYGGLLYFTLDLVFVCQVTDFSSLCAKDDAETYLFIAPNHVSIEEIGLTSIKEVVKQYCASIAKGLVEGA
ncbi:MAG: NUDIX hydrolase [Bacteroidales bacterium]